jgi:hypoxanthine-guanine phosphoribosyltransferase
MVQLLRELTFDCEINFIRVVTYEGTPSTGKVNTTLNLKSDIKGKHVIIVDDILDTGLTLI